MEVQIFFDADLLPAGVELEDLTVGEPAALPISWEVTLDAAPAAIHPGQRLRDLPQADAGFPQAL